MNRFTPHGAVFLPTQLHAGAKEVVARFAPIHGARLLSAYTVPSPGRRVWVITEADRSATTILLPSEY